MGYFLTVTTLISTKATYTTAWEVLLVSHAMLLKSPRTGGVSQRLICSTSSQAAKFRSPWVALRVHG